MSKMVPLGFMVRCVLAALFLLARPASAQEPSRLPQPSARINPPLYSLTSCFYYLGSIPAFYDDVLHEKPDEIVQSTALLTRWIQRTACESLPPDHEIPNGWTAGIDPAALGTVLGAPDALLRMYSLQDHLLFLALPFLGQGEEQAWDALRADLRGRIRSIESSRAFASRERVISTPRLRSLAAQLVGYDPMILPEERRLWFVRSVRPVFDRLDLPVNGRSDEGIAADPALLKGLIASWIEIRILGDILNNASYSAAADGVLRGIGWENPLGGPTHIEPTIETSLTNFRDLINVQVSELRTNSKAFEAFIEISALRQALLGSGLSDLHPVPRFAHAGNDYGLVSTAEFPMGLVRELTPGGEIADGGVESLLMMFEETNSYGPSGKALFLEQVTLHMSSLISGNSPYLQCAAACWKASKDAMEENLADAIGKGFQAATETLALRGLCRRRFRRSR
jgi:hypothetical protein